MIDSLLRLKSYFTVSIVFLSFAWTAWAQTPPVKLEGQVVCCADCWAEADRATVQYGTAEDLLKAKSCVENGDPTLIAVRANDKFTFYQLETGKFRLPGKNWLEFVGKKVRVTGAVGKKKNAQTFRVDRLEILERSVAEREAANVVGQTIDLKLKDLFGAEASLAQYRGRIVVLNFWATYCLPCRKEMPDLAAIQNEYAALGVQVIGASTDAAGDRAKVLAFIKETKVNFPVWLGANSTDTTRYGLGEALPGTVVLDRTGKIVQVISGVVNPAELKKQLDRMIETAENDFARNRTTAAARNEETEKIQKVSSVPS